MCKILCEFDSKYASVRPKCANGQKVKVDMLLRGCLLFSLAFMT